MSLVGGGRWTVIGFDHGNREIFVKRARSGNVKSFCCVGNVR